MDLYRANTKMLIMKLLTADRKVFEFAPTLFGDNSDANVDILRKAFESRQNTMKEGEISQIVLGNFPGWEDLGVGHESGVDCRKLDNSIIVELKNKYNTCNSGSQKSVLDKLAEYKRLHPTTRVVWGIINAKSGSKKMNEIIHHGGVDIEKIQGRELCDLVFTHNGTNYAEMVVDMVAEARCEIVSATTTTTEPLS